MPSWDDEIVRHLRQLYPHIRMPSLTLKNVVVSAHLKTNVPLHRVQLSSSDVSYEPELFPAMLLRRYHPIHIAIFHNGRCIITGLRSVEQGQTIVNEVTAYLKRNNLLSV